MGDSESDDDSDTSENPASQSPAPTAAKPQGLIGDYVSHFHRFADDSARAEHRRRVEADIEARRNNRDEQELIYLRSGPQIFRATVWAVVVSGLAFVVSFCALVALIFQTRLSQSQLGEMQKEHLLDERAWVMPLGCDSAMNEDGSAYFIVTIKNTGKTPALRMSATINHAARALVPDDDIPRDTTVAALLAPDATSTTSTIDIPTDNFTVGWIKTNRPIYCVFGKISYWDIFGRPHWTQFNYLVGSDLKHFTCPAIHNTTEDETNAQFQAKP